MNKDNSKLKKYDDVINLIKSKNYKDAEINLLNVVKDEKNDFYPHQLLGIVYSKLGDLNKAISHFEISVKINPKNPGVIFNLAMIYQDQGNLEKSKDFFLKTIELDKNFIEAYLNIAKVFEKQQNFIESDKYYQKCLSINSEYLPAIRLYSNFLVNIGEISRALSYQYKYFGIIKFNNDKPEII